MASPAVSAKQAPCLSWAYNALIVVGGARLHSSWRRVGIQGIGCDFTVGSPQMSEKLQTGDAGETVAWMGECVNIKGVISSQELLDESLISMAW